MILSFILILTSLSKRHALFGLGGGLVAKLCLTLATPWTTAHQAPPSMGFSRQEYWSGVPLPSPSWSVESSNSHSSLIKWFINQSSLQEKSCSACNSLTSAFPWDNRGTSKPIAKVLSVFFLFCHTDYFKMYAQDQDLIKSWKTFSCKTGWECGVLVLGINEYSDS